MKKEIVYVISDSVGETAKFVTKAVSKQFNGDHVEIKRRSYVEENSEIEEIISLAKKEHSIIVYTIVIPSLKAYLDQRAREEKIIAIDILGPLLMAFERKLNKVPKNEPGLMRELDADYFERVDAIEFAVKCDDGKDPQGALQADIVLIGVSRTSKTPLSMYLAHKGFKVANIPLVPEVSPPEELFELSKGKCVGLIINPKTLHDFRKERLKSLGLVMNSNYTRLDRILEELEYAEKIMRRIGCPIINVSNKAIEETANLIIDVLQIERRS